MLVPGIGLDRGGARRWLNLGGFSLQPSELAKVSVVLFLARTLSRGRENLRRLPNVLSVLGVVGLCAGLILLQPDFGSARSIALGPSMPSVAGAHPVHLALDSAA